MERVPLTPDYKEFLQFLNSENVEYLVVGAFAVGHHGYVRSTGDLDIWVQQSPENIDRLVRVMHRFGFAEKSISKATFFGSRKVFQIGVRPNRIDLLTEISAVDFDTCVQNAEQGNFDGVSVPIIGLEDLRINKKASGRHKDLADWEELE